LGGQASQEGEELRMGEKSMSIFCLGCIPMPAPAVGNTDSFTMQPARGFLLSSSVELNPPSFYNTAPLNGVSKLLTALNFSKRV